MNVYYGKTCEEFQIRLLLTCQVRSTSIKFGAVWVVLLLKVSDWAGNIIRQVLSKPLDVIAVHLNA